MLSPAADVSGGVNGDVLRVFVVGTFLERESAASAADIKQRVIFELTISNFVSVIS